jgi:3-dehydroquinate synthase
VTGESHSVDVSFSVPFVHRLRFTDDVLGRDIGTLTDLLDAPPDCPARAVVVVEDGVAAGLPEALRNSGRVEITTVLTVSGGESIKNHPARLVPVLDAILHGNIDRRSYVIVAGGGAVLDAVGLAVAVAHRGVRLIRLPTTTLSQGDSGVGVKNAINFFGRKNWIGTFAVPWAVVNDRRLLDTLPDRDWRTGFTEAVKVSLLKDPFFFDQICRDAGAIAARDWSIAGAVLRHSALLHLRHITTGGDPFETREARPLDFGHWSAHRIEAMTGYTVRHGEAVGIGIAIDCVYSSLTCGLPPAAADRVIQCLHDLGLPTSHPMLADADGLLNGLEEFRQHLGGRLTVTMLRDVGDPIDVHAIDHAAMREAIARVGQNPGQSRG